MMVNGNRDRGIPRQGRRRWLTFRQPATSCRVRRELWRARAATMQMGTRLAMGVTTFATIIVAGWFSTRGSSTSYLCQRPRQMYMKSGAATVYLMYDETGHLIGEYNSTGGLIEDVQSGTSLPELMERGGWKSYEMVLRYAHLAPEKLSSVASRIARRVSSVVSSAESTTNGQNVASVSDVPGINRQRCDRNRPKSFGAPGGIRTPDPLVRRRIGEFVGLYFSIS